MIEVIATRIKFFEKNFPSKSLFFSILSGKSDDNIFVKGILENNISSLVKKTLDYLLEDAYKFEREYFYRYFEKFDLLDFKGLRRKDIEKNFNFYDNIKDTKKRIEFFFNRYELIKKLDNGIYYNLFKSYLFSKEIGLDKEIKYINKFLDLANLYINRVYSTEIILGFLILLEYTIRILYLIKKSLNNNISRETVEYIIKNLKWPY